MMVFDPVVQSFLELFFFANFLELFDKWVVFRVVQVEKFVGKSIQIPPVDFVESKNFQVIVKSIERLIVSSVDWVEIVAILRRTETCIVQILRENVKSPIDFDGYNF